MEPLLEFLKNTEIENRGRAAKRETKWQKKRDQEGKDQLKDV